MNEAKEIYSGGRHPDDRGCYFSVDDENKVYISAMDMSLIDKIRELPAHTRIAIMSLSYEEVRAYVENKHREAASRLVTLLRRKWFWRDTGEVADFKYRGMFPGTDMTISQLRRRLRSKKPPDRKFILELTDFLTGERAEVYTKGKMQLPSP